MLSTFIVCMMIGGGGVMAYETGPPVGVTGYENLCKDMFPVGHVDDNDQPYDAQLTDPPFVVEFSGPSCYNDTSNHTITVRTKTSDESGYIADAEIEGVFVQAKLAYNNADGNYGTFTENEIFLKLQPCFNRDGSAASHSTELHDQTVTFYWVSTQAQATEELVFAATVVRHKNEFWVGIESDKLKPCSATSLTVSIMMLAMSAIFAISTSQ